MNRVGRRGFDIAVWLMLLSMPYWMAAIGGYTELATRIVVMGLAAMSLNFLLGFTGVLSFGHAAYFGLGAYGTAMTIKYLVPNTLLGMLVGIATATIAAAVIGALIVRRRGVYFAMVTIAFGQVFYFIAFRWNAITGGDDGLTDWHRMPIDLGFTRLDIFGSDKAFYYFVLAVFAVCVTLMASLLNVAVRPHAARHPRERAPGALPRHSGRSAHLDVVRDLVPVRERRGLPLRAPQQFHRSACAALRPLGQFRHHGGARRDAVVLGPADRRSDLRGAAGLRVQPHHELDVGDRPRASCWWSGSSRAAYSGRSRRRSAA